MVATVARYPVAPPNDSSAVAGDQPPTAPPSAADLARLNARYTPLSYFQRVEQLYRDFAPEQILVTSSFGATAAFLLHVFSRVRPDQPITFINTGYHFLQTLQFRDALVRDFHLNVRDLRAEDWKHDFTVSDKTYERDPDYCCAINKVEPLDAIKPNYQVWVSSVMGWETETRGTLKVFEARDGLLKFSPMVDVSREERDAYFREHQLPTHPLVAEGYGSIGCTHCTQKGEGRSGRWAGKAKTECGLHK